MEPWGSEERPGPPLEVGVAEGSTMSLLPLIQPSQRLFYLLCALGLKISFFTACFLLEETACQKPLFHSIELEDPKAFLAFFRETVINESLH